MLAGASQDSIDLLPSPASGAEWAKSLQTDEGHEGDQMFEFDGVTSAVIVPPSVLDHNLASTFTFSTWMKHKPQPGADKHVKEHVICSADDHSELPQSQFVVIKCILIANLFLNNTFSPFFPLRNEQASLCPICEELSPHSVVEERLLGWGP